MSKFKVTLQPSGHEFEVEQGESVLAAALRQGFVLPYGCRNGACGSCKGRILDGRVDYGSYQEKALPEKERAEGKALFCQAKPLSDLVLEARTIGAVKDIPIRTLPCRVQKMERLADDVIVLYLKLPANERLQFLAGQYLEFLLRDGSRRSFSMANAPHDDELIQLHVRHVPGGNFTDHVFGKMKERDILRFEGPHGTFFLREDSDKPIIFVAGSTGFAPVKSMLEYAFERGLKRRMILYWGVRRPEDMYLGDLAQQWAREHDNFEFVPVLSEPRPEDRWDGRTGLVPAAILADYPDPSVYQG